LLRSVAGMEYENETEKRKMSEWEKGNAVEHIRKQNVQEENLDSRVIFIENRFV